MIRIIADSGCSIKQDEKDKYNLDIIPLQILLDGKEYKDGIDLSMDTFYDILINKKQFPKTSLPCLTDVEDLVNSYTSNGDEVFIITISSGISGTNNALKLLFQENDKVHIIDSKCAVGGMRFIVECINKNKELPVSEILKKIDELIPRIVTMAIPETLEYLHRGGRLSKIEMILGSLLLIKPVIGFKDGKVSVLAKKHGINNSMKYVAQELKNMGLDDDYGIIASYTHNKENVLKLIKNTDPEIASKVYCFDDLTPAIACHWGPNAFGYIFVKK
ncbi:MAG: DegV family protein [Anaeroplasmataceae bacterium]